MNGSSPNHEKESLVQAYLEESLRPEESERLLALLHDDPNLAQKIFSGMRLDSMIREVVEQVNQDIPAASSVRDVDRKRPQRRSSQRASWPKKNRFRLIVAFSAAAGVALAIGLLAILSGDTQPQNTVIARLAEVEGTVHVASGADASRPGRVGQKLFPGQTIVAEGAGSRAAVAYLDKTKIELKASSGITLNELNGQKRIRLNAGALTADVAKQTRGAMVLTTDHARITVLGTQFRLSIDSSATRLEVSRGEVELTRIADNKTAVVKQGFVAMAGPNVAPQPKPVRLAAMPDRSLQGRSWYVALDGRPDNAGTKDRPWDLATAMMHPKQVRPGDTIWIHGGAYTPAPQTGDTAPQFNITLKGAKEHPIILRAVSGERVTLKGGVVNLKGRYTWLWGVEVTNREAIAKQPGIQVSGRKLNNPGLRLINCIVHDNGQQGISHFQGATNSEVHGCIIYNNGFRNNGKGLFVLNNPVDGGKRIKNNILFRSFENNLAIGGTAAPPNTITLEGNTIFNARAYDILKMALARNIDAEYGENNYYSRLIENYTYMPSDAITSVTTLGSSRDGVLEGNYLVCPGRRGFAVHNVTGFRMNNNTIVGALIEFTINQYGTGNVHLPERPAERARIFIRPNDYEAGRANITIYNWGRAASVTIDVSAAGLKNGDAYEVRDAQNWYGQPVLSGTYDGSLITIPMTGLSAAPALGVKNTGIVVENFKNPPPHTVPEFGVFVIRKRHLR